MLFFLKSWECLLVLFLLLLRFGWDAVEGLDSPLSLFELSGSLGDLASLFVSLVDLFLLSDLCFTSVWFGYSCLRSVILLCSELDLLSTEDFLILRIDVVFGPSIHLIESLNSLRLLSGRSWSSSLRSFTCHLWCVQRSERITAEFEIWEIFFIGNVDRLSVVSSSE